MLVLKRYKFLKDKYEKFIILPFFNNNSKDYILYYIEISESLNVISYSIFEENPEFFNDRFYDFFFIFFNEKKVDIKNFKLSYNNTLIKLCEIIENIYKNEKINLNYEDTNYVDKIKKCILNGEYIKDI